DGNHEECGFEPALNLEILVEPRPEILCPAEMDEGQDEGRRPVSPQRSRRRLARAGVDKRTDHRPIKESEHAVVELVETDGRVVDVVGQTDDESIPLRDRWNLHQRETGTDDAVAQKRDM